LQELPDQLAKAAPQHDVAAAIRAWNYLNGEPRMDESLAAVAEVIGFRDIEILFAQLLAIREHQAAQQRQA